MDVAADSAIAPDRCLFTQMHVSDYLGTDVNISRRVNLRMNTTKRSDHEWEIVTLRIAATNLGIRISGFGVSILQQASTRRVDSRRRNPKFLTDCAKFVGMDRRTIPLAALLLSSALALSCSTSLFKVKPATELPPLPANSRVSEASGLTFRVAPLLSDEELQDLFEANLPVAGILAVRLEMNLQSGAPVELKRARFVVRDSQNRSWKLLSSKQAVSRIMKANGVRLYNPHGKKQFESDLGAYAFDTKTPLTSNRSGFLFFQTPDKRPVDTSQKLTLVIERLPQPASITLN